jgi:hypothetical protein
VTCTPLRRRQMACLSRACPYPEPCQSPLPLGPTFSFQEIGLRRRAVANRRRREGHRQPAGRPSNNCTRRAGRRCRSAQLRQGRRAARGPGPAQRPGPAPGRAVAAAAELCCSRPSALRAVRNQLERRAAVQCGPGAACKTVASDWRWATARRRTSPPGGSCRCVIDPQTAVPSTTTAALAR